jgi:ABC-type nitrate/sulfonate/bicarbonate transport system permease component
VGEPAPDAVARSGTGRRALARAIGMRPLRRMLAAPSLQPLHGSGPQLLALVGGVLVWEALGRALGFPWLPPFSRVVAATADLIASGRILGNLVASLAGLAIGYTFSVVVGVVVGALMARYRKVEYALDLYVNAMLFAPSIIFAPIFFTLFGLSDITRVGVIVLYTVFIIVINTFTGFRGVDPALVEMARSFGATERQLFVRVLLPASLPMVFAGLRLGMGRAVKGRINGEMFIALVGLGALLHKYGGQFDAERVLGITLVVLAVALVLARLVQWLDRRLTAWAG